MQEKKCRHFNICGLFTENEDEYCILHSSDENKSIDSFNKHFQNHLRNKGYYCKKFVFPTDIDFSQLAISETSYENEPINFEDAQFLSSVNFDKTSFFKDVSFKNCTFKKDVDFNFAKFHGRTDFESATFESRVRFNHCRFNKATVLIACSFNGVVEFFETIFTDQVSFANCTFSETTRFKDIDLNCEEVIFSNSLFLAPTIFSTSIKSKKIFEEVTVYFEEVTIHPSSNISFIDADLSKAVFYGTDLRNIELSSIRWARIGSRIAVYDEVLMESDPNSPITYESLEDLYRDLKLNYSEQRDYVNAGHFHYGEKEALRKRSKNGLRVLLCVYKLISGYGEKVYPAVLWLVGIYILCAVLFYFGGIEPALAFNNEADRDPSLRLTAYLLHSAETTFYLGGKTYVESSHISSVVALIQSILSPIFLALLALAIRQKLKR